jgi:Tic22-like family
MLLLPKQLLRIILITEIILTWWTLLEYEKYQCAAMVPMMTPLSIRTSARSAVPFAAVARRSNATAPSVQSSSSRGIISPAARCMDRRRLLPLILASWCTLGGLPFAAPAIPSADAIAQLLHVIPTFTLVDAEGVPYMVVGADARVTGYFFTTYGEAERIRALAARGGGPWPQARISTVPLDVAVTLSLKAGAGNIRNSFQVAPAASDVREALAVTGQDDVAEGKVPLFYFANFTMAGTEDMPVYFQKDQLIREYKLQTKTAEDDLPSVQVTELFAVLTAMVQQSTKDTDLNHIVFVAPPESRQRAQECQRRGGKKPPFVLGQRNIVL